MTTTIGLNEVASCHRQLGCRDGYTLARNIVSIDGLQDCQGCQDDDGWRATGEQPESGWLSFAIVITITILSNSNTGCGCQIEF